MGAFGTPTYTPQYQVNGSQAGPPGMGGDTGPQNPMQGSMPNAMGVISPQSQGGGGGAAQLSMANQQAPVGYFNGPMGQSSYQPRGYDPTTQQAGSQYLKQMQGNDPFGQFNYQAFNTGMMPSVAGYNPASTPFSQVDSDYSNYFNNMAGYNNSNWQQQYQNLNNRINQYHTQGGQYDNINQLQQTAFSQNYQPGQTAQPMSYGGYGMAGSYAQPLNVLADQQNNMGQAQSAYNQLYNTYRATGAFGEVK